MDRLSAPVRPELLRTGTEREQLEAFLDFFRATLLDKCAGLDLEQLSTPSAPPSTLTLLGLLRHMTGVEEWWFQEQLTGDAPIYTYDATEDPDTDFNDLGSLGLGEVLSAFERAVVVSRTNLAAYAYDDIAAGKSRAGLDINVRWIVVHMIEEYARHVGHADLLRERIDGATGY